MGGGPAWVVCTDCYRPVVPYILCFDLLELRGSLHVNIHVSKDDRLGLGLYYPGGGALEVYAIRGRENLRRASAQVPFDLEAAIEESGGSGVTLAIVVEEGYTEVHVQGAEKNPVLAYKDPQPPVHGAFGFETLDDSYAVIDNLGIKQTAPEPAPSLLEGRACSGEPGDESQPLEGVGIEAKVLLRLSHVPTAIVHLFDPTEHPLVTFQVRKAQPGGYVRLRLKSFVEEYSTTAVDTVEIEYSEKPQEIHQLPTFFPERMRAVTELTRATLHIVIDDLDGATEQESTFPLWLLARNSAYNARIEDPAKGRWVDLSRFYGAWVTPNAPEILELLRRVADLHPGRAITGYLSRSIDATTRVQEVEEQVKAVYNALKAEEILYIRSGLTLGAGEGESMQRARLPREVLATKSANCLDGTLLMASVLEAVSLSPGLALVPGHAFLAWEKQPSDRWEGQVEDRWDYMETTMLSTDSFEAAQAEGRRQASCWQGKRQTMGKPWLFRRLSEAELRSKCGIVPME